MSMSLDLAPLPLGTRLKLRRIAAGLKQSELAAAIGTHTSRVCEAEHGRGRLSDATLLDIQTRMDAALREHERIGSERPSEPR